MRHKRDWPQYNKSLINQGKVNFWISEEALTAWYAEVTKKNGHPFVYSNEAIKTMLFIRFKFNLSFGAWEVTG